MELAGHTGRSIGAPLGQCTRGEFCHKRPLPKPPQARSTGSLKLGVRAPHTASSIVSTTLDSSPDIPGPEMKLDPTSTVLAMDGLERVVWDLCGPVGV